MSEWLHTLPVGWMALVVFTLTYLVTGGIHAVVMALAVNERARAFKAVLIASRTHARGVRTTVEETS